MLQIAKWGSGQVGGDGSPMTILARGLHGAPSSLGARKVAVAVVGFGVLGLGLALAVFPIPGLTLLVVPLGLAILAREFAWARRRLDQIKKPLRRLRTKARQIVARASAGGCFASEARGDRRG